MLPLVSVIVPVYNGEKSIGECLKSITGQEYDNLEIIVIDDGSTDSTGEIVESFRKNDSRIMLLQQVNGGVSAARNSGLDMCRGKYVRFVDADDVLLPDSIHMMVERAERDGSDLVLSPYVEKVGEIRHVRDLGKGSETVDIGAYLALMYKYSTSFYYGVLWNKLFSTEKIREAGCRFERNISWCEDLIFMCDYLSGKVDKISFIDKPTYVYQRNLNGLTAHLTCSVIRHPVESIRKKLTVYGRFKSMYISRGKYDEYKGKLWSYLFKFAINQ